MKKVISTTAIAVIFLSSCVKDRTCQCDYANGGGTASTFVIHDKRKPAKQLCEAQSNSSVNCYLK